MGKREEERLLEYGITQEEWEIRVAEFNGCCAYCLQPMGKLVIEHMIPLSRGGKRDIANVVPACVGCNMRKGTKSLLDVLAGGRVTGGKVVQCSRKAEETGRLISPDDWRLIYQPTWMRPGSSPRY